MSKHNRRYFLLYAFAATASATLSGFVFGLVGHIGSIHHAAHVALVVGGIFLLLWALVFLIYAFAWFFGEA